MADKKEKPIFIKGPYDPVEECNTDTVGHSLTQQQFKDECDIHRILTRYAEYGTCDHLMRVAPKYVDCTHISSKTFQDHLDFMMDFDDYFDSLPQEVRDKFDDDPEAMMEYLADEKNFEAACELGIISKDSERATASERPLKNENSTPSSESSEVGGTQPDLQA